MFCAEVELPKRLLLLLMRLRQQKLPRRNVTLLSASAVAAAASKRKATHLPPPLLPLLLLRLPQQLRSTRFLSKTTARWCMFHRAMRDPTQPLLRGRMAYQYQNR